MKTIAIFMGDDHDIQEMVEKTSTLFPDDRGIMVYGAVDPVADKLLDVFNEAERLDELNDDFAYTKKPVTIEARQLDGTYENTTEIMMWIAGYGGDCLRMHSVTRGYGIKVKTLEGDHEAWKDDWMIRGVKDEFYPCKPDIFEATYSKGR